MDSDRRRLSALDDAAELIAEITCACPESECMDSIGALNVTGALVEAIMRACEDDTSAAVESCDVFANVTAVLRGVWAATDAPTDAPTHAPTDAPTHAPTATRTVTPGNIFYGAVGDLYVFGHFETDTNASSSFNSDFLLQRLPPADIDSSRLRIRVEVSGGGCGNAAITFTPNAAIVTRPRRTRRVASTPRSSSRVASTPRSISRCDRAARSRSACRRAADQPLEGRRQRRSAT